MLSVECPKCSRSFQVSPEWTGKTAKCKTCNTRILIPAAAAVSSRPDTATFSTSAITGGAPETTTEMNVVGRTEELPTIVAEPISREAILAALPASIEPVRVAPGYMLALSVVAFLLVLLPILYLGLTLLVAYGVYWHFAHGQWVTEAFGQVRGKAAALMVIAYLAPGVIGAILVLFMFKPLFNWRRWDGKPFTLSRENEPLLYEYVDRLCDCVGAPRPVRIDLRGDVNASASFASAWSILSNRLVLTLGLPLVAGVPLRNLTGVLAHEFGHFSQFWAMRMTYVIETINNWFHRVVEERDSWDQALDAWSQKIDIRVGWVLYLARFFVWVVRKILWGFRLLGLLFSRRLARQMEFDADQYEIRIAGSRAFAETSERMAVLNFAEMIARRGATQFLREGRAIDDFARFVTYQVGELKPDQLQPLLERVRNQPPAWDSTHPSDAERIARATACPTPSAFTLDCPATAIFRDFPALSREFTRRGYRKGSGESLTLEELSSVEDLYAEQKQRRASFEAARRFVVGVDAALEQFKIDDWALDTEDSTDVLRERVRAMRQQLLTERSAYLAAAQEREQGQDNTVRVQVLRVAIVANQKVKELQLPGQSPAITKIEQVKAWIEEWHARQDVLEAKLSPFESAFAVRLRTDLQLAIRREAEAEGKLVTEIRRLWEALGMLAPAEGLVTEMQSRLSQLGYLFSRLQEQRGNEALVQVIEKIREALLDELQKVWGHLSGTPYPFALARPVEHLAEALLSHTSDANNPISLYEDVEQLCTSYWSLWRRILGRLAEIGEDIEGTEGLPPLSA